MWYLKSKGYIDDIVFAIFTDLDKLDGENKPKSHIKLGGFDNNNETLKDGTDLTFLASRDLDHWSLTIKDVKIDTPDQNYSLKGDIADKHIEFYPNLPWIYIPVKDFQMFKVAIHEIYGQ